MAPARETFYRLGGEIACTLGGDFEAAETEVRNTLSEMSFAPVTSADSATAPWDSLTAA